jgi:hypothetical protein
VRRSDVVFAGRVLAYLAATKQIAKVDRFGTVTIKSGTRHSLKAQARARFKRLRKEYRRAGLAIPDYWP